MFRFYHFLYLIIYTSQTESSQIPLYSFVSSIENLNTKFHWKFRRFVFTFTAFIFFCNFSLLDRSCTFYIGIITWTKNEEQKNKNHHAEIAKKKKKVAVSLNTTQLWTFCHLLPNNVFVWCNKYCDKYINGLVCLFLCFNVNYNYHIMLR